MMSIIEKDSKLLQKHKLIDYSVFLILVSRETKLSSASQSLMGSLRYNPVTKSFSVGT